MIFKNTIAITLNFLILSSNAINNVNFEIRNNNSSALLLN